MAKICALEPRLSNEKILERLLVNVRIAHPHTEYDGDKAAAKDDVHYLSSVLLARLDEAEPPFSGSDSVRLKKSAPRNLKAENQDIGSDYVLKRGPAFSIRRRFYEGKGRWMLELMIAHEGYYRYPAEHFEKA